MNFKLNNKKNNKNSRKIMIFFEIEQGYGLSGNPKGYTHLELKKDKILLKLQTENLTDGLYMIYLINAQKLPSNLYLYHIGNLYSINGISNIEIVKNLKEIKDLLFDSIDEINIILFSQKQDNGSTQYEIPLATCHIDKELKFKLLEHINFKTHDQFEKKTEEKINSKIITKININTNTSNNSSTEEKNNIVSSPSILTDTEQTQYTNNSLQNNSVIHSENLEKTEEFKSQSEQINSNNFQKAEKIETSFISAPLNKIEKLSTFLDCYCSRINPFNSNVSCYCWWKIKNINFLDIILKISNISLPNILKQKIYVSFHEMYHIISGIYHDNNTNKNCLVIGMPDINGNNLNLYQGIFKWIPCGKFKDSRNIWGYWLLYIDLENGNIIRCLKQP